MKSDTFCPFVMLRAVDGARGEVINAGIILFGPERILVGVASTTGRIRALHPDFASIDLQSWGARLEASLNDYAKRFGSIEKVTAMLPLLSPPFSADTEVGTTQVDAADPMRTVEQLLDWQVNARTPTVRPQRSAAKRPTKLGIEIQRWLQSYKVFSRNMGDLSNNRVVANYPVLARSDLYADFAVSNGTLSALEVMDLRSIDHLTAAVRGIAAIKGITLDAARDSMTPLAVVAASNYTVARPAIALMSRYADDVFDLGTADERDRFASFMAKTLKRQDMVAQAMDFRDTAEQ